MRISLVTKGVGKSIEVSEGETIHGLVKANSLNQETFVIKLNDKVAHPSQQLSDGDVLEFVEIIYGG